MQTSKSPSLNRLLARLRNSQSQQQISNTFHFYSGDPKIDLVTFACLYLKCRDLCYKNYMETGIELFSACVKVTPAITEYCTETDWPDTCICGFLFSDRDRNLRSHCLSCKGSHSRYSLEYEIQRISQYFGIHHSWLEMAFASAISILNGHKQ